MTIHMIGNRPYTTPCDAASRDRSTGIPKARIATRIADGQAGQAGDVGLGLQDSEQDEDDEQRDDGNHRGQEDAVADRFDVGLVRGRH